MTRDAAITRRKNLTPHAVVFRYPDAPEEPDEAEAFDAIA
jgi:hypothetical protein